MNPRGSKHVVDIRTYILTVILLMWRIWWASNNASRWQMGFNSAFKGLIDKIVHLFWSVLYSYNRSLPVRYRYLWSRAHCSSLSMLCIFVYKASGWFILFFLRRLRMLVDFVILPSTCKACLLYIILPCGHILILFRRHTIFLQLDRPAVCFLAYFAYLLK